MLRGGGGGGGGETMLKREIKLELDINLDGDDTSLLCLIQEKEEWAKEKKGINANGIFFSKCEKC